MSSPKVIDLDAHRPAPRASAEEVDWPDDMSGPAVRAKALDTAYAELNKPAPFSWDWGAPPRRLKLVST